MQLKPPTALDHWETSGVAVSAPELDSYVQRLSALGPLAMTAGQLDGLLAAVLTSPRPISPEEVLASIWILDEDDPEPDVDWDAPEVIQAVASVMTRLAELSDGLDMGKFEPLFDVDLDGDIVWETWADGFMVGMTLAPDGWAERVGARSAVGEAANLMLTLIDVSRDDAETMARLGPRTAESFRENAPDLLTECVLELAQPELPRIPVVHGPKIGRNDPCPCGSGKKNKKCCGAAGAGS